MADHLIVCGALLLGIIGFIEAQQCNEGITGNGVAYRGCQQYTRSGLLCQRWDAQFPQQHKYTPASYPNDGLTANYCRNPNGEDSGIFCYTTDPLVRWEYCDPLPGGSAEYRGYQQYTRSGKLCQRWDAQSPQQHKYTPAAYPNSGLNANYCRNPGGEDASIWCYTTDPAVRWEYCEGTPMLYEGLTGDGVAYRGAQQYTQGGKACQRWDAQSPQQHKYSPAAYPNAGLNENYCRNPGSEDASIWCYTTDPAVRWDYCKPLPALAIAAPRIMNVFVHLANRVAAVRWGLAQGANAVEMDLQFQGGTPKEFRHGYEPNTDLRHTYGVGMVLKRDTGKITDASTPAVEMLTALGSAEFRDRLAVIYIDSKFNSGMIQSQAGANIVKMINQYVFGNGYRGQVVINSDGDHLPYTLAAKSAADQSPYKARYFYTNDIMLDDFAWQAGKKLQTRNVLYWMGVSFLQGGSYQPTVSRAVQAKKYAGVGIYTVDHQPTMDLYVNSGVDSIMSNDPALAVNVAKARGISLAKPGGAYPVR